MLVAFHRTSKMSILLESNITTPVALLFIINEPHVFRADIYIPALQAADAGGNTIELLVARKASSVACRAANIGVIAYLANMAG